MSALEQTPLPSSSDRRRAERMKLDRVLHALVGRHDGVFVDLSVRGARIRHGGALRRGATTRIVFLWERERFSATAEVLASRIACLGTRDGESATYESRFRFVSMDEASSALLARVLVAMSNDALRAWVGNLKGFDDKPAGHRAAPGTAGFLRCRRVHMRWEKKWTRNPEQPPDGFLLPAGTAPSEVNALCEAWESMDDDGRRLLQLTATAVVESAIADCVRSNGERFRNVLDP